MYNKIKLIKLVLIFVLFASPSFSIPIKFEGNFIQGSFILGKTEPNSKVFISNDFSKVSITSYRILITAAGLTSGSELENLKYKLGNQRKKIIGWILLNYESKYLV